MKRSVLLSLVVLIGAGILIALVVVGKIRQKVLREYELAKAKFHMTDADMAYFVRNRAQMWDGIKRQDEAAAAMALAALEELEHGDIEETRKILETEVSTYYRGHHDDGNSIFLHSVEIFAAKNTSFSNAIYRGSE
jgi:uncharacterized membrane protein